METGGGCSGGLGKEAAQGEREREWEEAAEAVAYDSCTSPPPVVAVCGPGNSGKSAFSRILLNTFIARYRKVGYMDIDVGQPEFTPPGFVSLHVFEEQAKGIILRLLPAIFDNSISAQSEEVLLFRRHLCTKKPKLLLTYIFELYDYFLKEFYCFREIDNPKKSAIPLVINTSGWVKGTGLHVLKEMLKYVSPTHVIRISTTIEHKNLPDGMFWMNQYDEGPPVNLVDIRAAQNSPRRLLVKREARIIRDLRLKAYFRQCLPRDFNVFCLDDLTQGFASIPPFHLHCSKIHVIDLHCQESDTDVHRFLNGTIVGLATSVSPPSSVECSTPCCIGLGFIKAVDISEDCIHLITPVSHELMEKVNVIFKSCIAVPSCLLQVSDTLSDITDRLMKL